MSSKQNQGSKTTLIWTLTVNFVLNAAKTQRMFVHHYKRGTRVAVLKYQKGLGHLRTRPISRVVGKSMLGVGFRGKILDLLLNPTRLQRNLDPFILPLLSSLKNTPIESLHHTASSLQCILPHFWCFSLSICSKPVYQIHIRSKLCCLFPLVSLGAFALAWNSQKAAICLRLLEPDWYSSCLNAFRCWLTMTWRGKKTTLSAWMWLMQ